MDSHMKSNSIPSDREIQHPEMTERDINHLKEWIAKQPHLPQEQEDVWLESFLYGRNYSLEGCKEAFDKYYTLRNTMPDIFSNRDPSSSEIRNSVNLHAQFPLPDRHPNGYLVGFGKLVDFNAEKFDLKCIVRKMSISADYYVKKERRQCYLIVDLEGTSLSHLYRASPSLIRDALHCLQEAYPLKLQKILLINSPSFTSMAFKMFEAFMTKNTRSMTLVLEKLDNLYEYVPKEMLPEEYGGKAGTVKNLNDAWQTELENGRDWFLKEAAKKTDESKRMTTGIGHKSQDIYGIGGSFKKLSVD